MKSLTKVIYKNSKRKNEEISKNNSVPLASLAFLIVFLTLTITMASFSYTVTKGLLGIGQTYAFVNILFLMNFFILFTKSVFESLNVLYFAKDLRVLLRMPIKPKDILNSKFINMIISEYQMEIIMLGVPMVVYGILTKATFLFYIYMILVLLMLPIIPIMITSLIIAVIMRFTNFIKNKSKVMYITIIVTLFIIGFVTMGMNTETEFSVNVFRNIILKANGLAEAIADYFVLIKPIMNTMLNYNNLVGMQNLIIYILENIVCYYLILNIISKIYLKGAIGTLVNSSKELKENIREIKLEDFKKKNKTKAYILKELKILLRSPIFCLQCIIMPILDPIIIIGIVIGLIKFAEMVGLNLIAMHYNTVKSGFGGFIFIGTAQVFYMLNFSSIIAVSRESNYAILTKTIPISLEKQFYLKIFIGFLINSIASLLVSIAFFVFTKELIFSIILFITLGVLNIIGEKFKLLIDLRNPQMDWNSEYTMMKQNTNVMYELFYTVLVAGILIIIAKLFSKIELYISFCLILFVIINSVLSKFIKKNQAKLFEKIF